MNITNQKKYKKIIMMALIAIFVFGLGLLIPKVTTKAYSSPNMTITSSDLRGGASESMYHVKSHQVGDKEYLSFLDTSNLSDAKLTFKPNEKVMGDLISSIHTNDSNAAKFKIDTTYYNKLVLKTSSGQEKQFNLSNNTITLKMAASNTAGSEYIQFYVGDYIPGNMVDYHVAYDSSNVQIYLWRDVDGHAPVFSGETAYISNVDAPVTESQIRAGLQAYDNVDGNVTSRITLVSDGYTANNQIVGTYDIKYSVKDNANNVAYLTVKVSVVDVTAPFLTDNAPTLKRADQVLTNTYNDDHPLFGMTISQVLVYARSVGGSSLDHLTDNEILMVGFLEMVLESSGVWGFYDNTGSGVFFTSEWEGNLFFEIIKNPFENKTSFGPENYQGKFKVGDKYGNYSDVYTINYNYADLIAPTISGPNAYTSNPNQKLSIENIKAGLQAYDNKDGNRTSSITVKTDNYSDNYRNIGSHVITFQVADLSGNVATYNVTVTVTDNQSPIFYVNDAFITVDESLNWSLDQIISHLSNIGQLPENVQAFYTVTTTNYMAAPGEYEVTLSRNPDAPDTLKETLRVGIRVQQSGETEEPIIDDDNQDETPIVEQENESKIKEFFEKNWEYLLIGFIIFVLALMIARAFGFGRKRY